MKEVRTSDSTQENSSEANSDSTQSSLSRTPTNLTTSTLTLASTSNTTNTTSTTTSKTSNHLQSVSHPISITKDWTPSLDILAHQIFELDPSILTTTIDTEKILQLNSTHRLALYITMFCSILQAAFFSYMSL